jgi:hypothetical protein
MNAGCCNGVRCTIKGHSHHSMAKATEAPVEAPDMHCEHESKSALRQCSMACCQTHESSMVASIIFVLPIPEMVSWTPQALNLIDPTEQRVIGQPNLPPDQPPRILPS